jgi:hypothetical protein
MAHGAAHPYRAAPADGDVAVIPAEREAREPESIITVGAGFAPIVVMDSGFAAARRPGMTESKRNRDAVERRVAIDEVDALPGDHDAAVVLHQAVKGGAAEQPLLLAAVFDHHEF